MALKIQFIPPYYGDDWDEEEDEKSFPPFQTALNSYQQAFNSALAKDESEEHFKNLFNHFLKEGFDYAVNTHERIDAVIFDDNGNLNSLIEVKRPQNEGEYLTDQFPNRKALHEVLSYFYKHNTYSLNNVFITNGKTLYSFEARTIALLIEQNRDLKQLLQGFNEELFNQVEKTSELYSKIRLILEGSEQNLKATKINLLANDKEEQQRIYRVLCRQTLFREKPHNDANELNIPFYTELLHLMGLRETKENLLVANNEPATLITLTRELVTERNPALAKKEAKEELFDIAYRLVVLWLNRLLFLKLLEALLRESHSNNKLTLLSPEQTPSELASLFFRVLNKPLAERSEEDKKAYPLVPYLNSSLFTRDELEEKFDISALPHNRNLKIMDNSIINKYAKGKTAVKQLTTFQYVLSFLGCFQFNKAEGKTDRETLINSSVLGMVFEKLNGYKEGSHFTPALITNSMCKGLLEKTVLARFNSSFNLECNIIDDLISYAEGNFYKAELRERATTLLDNLTLIDPAVGSGHFLVTMLNQLVALKSRLHLLHSAIEVTIFNDELRVKYSDGKPFKYGKDNEGKIYPEQHKIQQFLFNTKKQIIENQLFGVDINPNSVNICRLRLWVELLKNSYFTDENNLVDMQTLPNLEFKVIATNSLVGLDTDKLFFPHKELDNIRKLMHDYFNAVGVQKEDFKETLTEWVDDLKKEWPDESLLQAYQPFKASTAQAFFDSRLMFGVDRFDMLAMNPPYIQLQGLKNQPASYKSYKSYAKMGDIYQLFLEKTKQFVKVEAEVSAIVSNKWMRAGYGQSSRNWLNTQTIVHSVVDLGAGWFASATVDTCIINYKFLAKAVEKVGERQSQIEAYTLPPLSKDKVIEDIEKELKVLPKNTTITPPADDGAWLILNPLQQTIKAKIEEIGKPLKDWDISINYGIKTGYNEAFIIDEAKKAELLEADPKNAEIIKPLARDGYIKSYEVIKSPEYLIHSHNGTKTVEAIDIKQYPFIKEHIDNIVKQVEEGTLKRRGGHTFNNKGFHERSDRGNTPYNLRSCSYIDKFEQPKIVWKQTSIKSTFAYDEEGYFLDVTGQMLTSKTLTKTHFLWILAFLNSSLIDFYMKMTASAFGSKGTRWIPLFIENLPIPIPTQEQEEELVSLVKQVLQAKTTNQDTQELEQQIDHLVCGLYGLNEEEKGEVVT